MSLIVVGSAGVVAVAIGWARAILIDEARYLRAIEPLASSPRFARISGISVAVTVQRRGRHLRVSHRSARALGTITTRVMRRPGFHHPWMIGHRLVHRHRSSLRVTATMLALASLGAIVSLSSRVGPRSGAVSAQTRPMRTRQTSGPSSR